MEEWNNQAEFNQNALLHRLTVIETKYEISSASMERDIREIKENIKILTTLADKGKGSLNTFLWFGGVVVGVTTTLAVVIKWVNGV